MIDNNTKAASMQPKVFNKRDRNVPADAVYIGRPSIYGNPFSHMEKTVAKYKVSTREEAIQKYEEWLLSFPELVAHVKKNLKGKNLVCWCKPHACHGDVLLRIANKDI